jgi:DNA-binding protein H-NS
MSDFFDRIKKLFAQAANEQQPATHEIFTRTAAEVEVYQQWKRSKRLPRILESFQARLEGRMSSEAELMLHFIDTPKSRGFVLLQ